MEKLRAQLGDEQYRKRRFATAAEILDSIITSDQFIEFLTLPAYQYLQ